jgi:hypothetical protein
MRVRIETVFDNVDQTWVDWWLERLKTNPNMPGAALVVEKLKKKGLASFESKDPDSEVIACTMYEIVKDRSKNGD